MFDTYTALMAPAKTPPEIVAGSRRSRSTSWPSPRCAQKLTAAGFEVTARTGKGHMARVAKEVPMFRDIIDQAGIKKL